MEVSSLEINKTLHRNIAKTENKASYYKEL